MNEVILSTSNPSVRGQNAKATSTLVRTVLIATLAVRSTSPIHAAEVIPAGTYLGTLACDQALTGSAQSFSAPITFKVDGATLTWTRETPAMREVVSGPIVDGKVALDGYGGSVSAATRQAFWDWRLAAQLVLADGGVLGTAELRSKDGRIVQQRCTVASLLLATPKTLDAGSSLQSRIPEPVTASGVAMPITPAPSPPAAPKVPSASAASNASAADANRTSALEAEVRRREEALSRREQLLAKRERALAQQQPKASPTQPTVATKPASPGAPPPAPNKPAPAAAQGDI